jgi:predicted nucleic acid-binding protein
VNAVVLDAWALLAWLGNEQPAADAVQEMLDAAEEGSVELHLSVINAGEVYYRLAKDRGRKAATRFRAGLASMPVRVHLPIAEDVWQAAQLKSRAPISYADGFAAALAQQLGAKLLTGDADFAGISDLRVEWLRRA